MTKVNKKLGIAIDGGANTKQQAITIRQITVGGGCKHACSKCDIKSSTMDYSYNSSTITQHFVIHMGSAEVTLLF